VAAATNSAGPGRLPRLWPALAVTAAGLAAIALDVELSEAYDQNTFHVPVIRTFAAQLPFPDIRGYQSTTTPLFYLVMSMAVRAGVESVAALRVITLALSVAGVCAIQWFFQRFAEPRRAALYAAAVGLSPYYLGSAVFVVTDNPPFALTALALGIALAPGPPRAALAAVIVTAIVLSRQIYVWLLPFFVVASSREGISRKAIAWMIVPALALGAMLLLWGGPLPRGYSTYPHPPSLLPLIAILTTVGWWGAPLLPALARSCHRGRAAAIFVAVAIAAVLLLTYAPITPGHPSPWGGGMRTLGKYGGSIAGTSVIYWIGMLLGSAGVAVIVARPHAPHERLLLIACAFWAAAQCLNAAMPDRYYQPFVLLVLLSFAAGLRGRLAAAGTLALIAAILAASFARFAIHGAGIVRL
jgi:hypothetical protein